MERRGGAAAKAGKIVVIEKVALQITEGRPFKGAWGTERAGTELPAPVMIRD
jgi:hypothetical protein